MTEEEFNKLASDLNKLSGLIPLNWGAIQNDGTDSKINMFNIHTFEELEKQSASLSEKAKNYFKRRWFLWKCAQCDEHIFCMNANVTPNPNARDQAYDIEFNNDNILRFDIKGTVIPREFRNDINAVLQNPFEMIKFFYEKQSTGVRDNIQNRLFVIHHSYRSQEREMYLRCHWAFKINLYQEYSKKIKTSSNFINFGTVKADVVFIFENLDGNFSHKIYSS